MNRHCVDCGYEHNDHRCPKCGGTIAATPSLEAQRQDQRRYEIAKACMASMMIVPNSWGGAERTMANAARHAVAAADALLAELAKNKGATDGN